jgi:hypothetical protein
MPGEIVPDCEVLFIDLLELTAPVLRRGGSVDSRGFLTPNSCQTLLNNLKNVVLTARPTRLIYLAEEGEPPCAKVDENRKRVFERIRTRREHPSTFFVHLSGHPACVTDFWQKNVKELVASAEPWSSVEVVFDSQWNPGEVEHKFAAYYRTGVAEGRFTRDTKITAFSRDGDVLNSCLLFHSPQMTVMMGKSGNATELVSISQLRSAIARLYGDCERRIDDLVALSFFARTDFIPGIASIVELEQAYHRVGNGFLVEGSEFNRVFLKQLFQELPRWAGTQNRSDDPALSARYLRSAAWTLRYYLCGCPQWTFAYSSVETPSLQGLIAAVETFDCAFEMDIPRSRLSMLLIKNTPRDRPDLPPECTRLKETPELARFFRADVPFECFPFSLYFDIFDRDILPTIDKTYLGMNTISGRLSFQNGRQEQLVTVNETTPFISDDSPIEIPVAIGDTVIFQHRTRAYVLGFSPDGISITFNSTPVPNCTDILNDDAHAFLPLKCCFSALGVRSKFYRVAHRILGTIMVDGINCGFGVVRTLDERHARLRVGRLGLIHFSPGDDGQSDVLISPRMRDAILEWCRRAPAIPLLIERDRPFTIESAFSGRANAASELREWMDGLFPDLLFPFVEETRSHVAMDQIAKRFARMAQSVVTRTVKSEDLLRKTNSEPGSQQIDWAKPVLSIASDESFGCSGYIVGLSATTKVAAVLFTSEGEQFTDFGCGTIGKKIGAIVPLDRLLQV